jgi:CHAD domain-containing protein
MRQPRQLSFGIDSGAEFKPLREELEKHFLVEGPETKRSRITYLETFDWRLFRKKLVCSVSDGQLVLTDFKNNIQARAAGSKQKKYFWWDLEESELQTRLHGVLDMRALLPLSTLRSETASFQLLNKDRKIVARLTLRNDETVSTPDCALPGILTLQEIRGYDKAFAKIQAICSSRGLTRFSPKKQLHSRVYSASERSVLDYGEKFRIDLPGAASIGEVVSAICLKLVEAMEQNYRGVIEDIDSEFLHDFRIAIRRTRSLLTLMKKVLPPEATAHFQEEFRWLGSVTGSVRDIDVYLLERDIYMDLLPEPLRPGLATFFAELERQRAVELKLLRRHLSSQRYEQLLAAWQHYLYDPGSDLFGSVRAKRCKPLVDSIITKRFKGFIKHGNRIDAASADQELHALRIKGKKLRYLLEFFRSFYDGSQTDRFLKQMKNLQDNLGDFNDLSVQQEMLGEHLDRLSGRNKRSVRLGAALGALISVLAGEHRQVRDEFQSTYSEFATAENMNLLQQMLAPGKGE